MATILGEANLSTSFLSFTEDTSVAHSSNSRSNTSDFKRPLIIRDGANNLEDTFQSFPSKILQYRNLDNNDYLITDPITNPAGSGTHGTIDPNLFFFQFNSSNEVAKAVIQMQFDFTEIDHNAIFDEPNSLEIQIDIQSHRKGHNSYTSNTNTGTPHFGKIEAYWQPEPTPTTFGRSAQATVELSDQTRQTITLSIPGGDNSIPSSNAFPNLPGTIAKFGKRPTVLLRFSGTVNNPLANLDDIPAGSNFKYSGRFNTEIGLEMRIFQIKARYKYTGRTHNTTGLIEPQGGDYGFTDMIPADAVYKGVGTLWQIDAPQPISSGSRILTLKSDSGDNLLHSNPNGPFAKQYQPSLGALTSLSNHGGSAEATLLYNNNEYTNIVDDGITRETILETSDIRDPSLELVLYTASGTGEVPLATKRLNIAYAPLFSGFSNINFGFSIADIDADQIHGIVDSELSDIAPSFTVTTLGGLRLGDPQPVVDASFTVEVDPSTAGLIKTDPAGVVNNISTSFTVTMDPAGVEVIHSTTVASSFNIAVADTAAVVLVNTLTSSPIVASLNFNLANPDADEVGVLHQVTSLVPAEPSAVVAIASLSSDDGDLVVIRAPSFERRLNRATRTHTFKADPQQRTVKLEPFTRSIQAETLKTLSLLLWGDTGTWSASSTWSSKTGKARNITVEQETRTVSSSQLDR